MSSPFLAGSSSSSASSHLSYLIPPRTPPPPPPHLMVQGFSCSVLAQAAGYSGNGVGGVVTTGGGDGVEAAAATAMRQGGRHAGHPPLPRPPPRQCPRCKSGNTKFCYYNNYSRKQPRYFCRACRRHWTEGGTLRDVPVGGGRKNRRGAAKASTAGATAAASAAATAAGQGSSGGGTIDAFPDILRQMLFQAPASCMAVGGGDCSIDMSSWQQMVAATALQGAGDVGAVGGTAADANCGGVQYWSGWQLQDDIPGFDGTF